MTSTATGPWPSPRGGGFPADPRCALPGVDGTIAYTPAAGYKGDDTFTYRVADNDGEFSTEAHVMVTVASNQPPTAEDDTFQTAANSPALLDILANDSAQDGLLDPVSLLVVADPAHGAVDIQPDGKVKYTPVAGFSGEDTFSYTVADFNGLVSNPALSTSGSCRAVIDNRDAQKVTSTGNWGVSGADGYWSTDSVWSRDGATFRGCFNRSRREATMSPCGGPRGLPEAPPYRSILSITGHRSGHRQPATERRAVESARPAYLCSGHDLQDNRHGAAGPSSTCADAVKFDLLDGGIQPVLAAFIGQVSPSPAVLGAPVTRAVAEFDRRCHYGI